MSACMRSLYSSDQCAPGFILRGEADCGVAVLLLGATRGATFSLSVGRGDVGLGLLIDL
jgi:hypothetical protein